MKLNKRYFRSIKSNKSFYVSATILTIMTLFLFYMMNVAGKAIWNFGDEFFISQNLEDAHFTTYIPILDEDIKKLEKEFSVELEPEYYCHVETDKTTTRVFKKTEKINLYSITEGKDITKNDEVIISEGYAVFNKIALGDSIKIGNKNYILKRSFET